MNPKHVVRAALAALLLGACRAPAAPARGAHESAALPAIQSRVERLATGERILVETVVVDAPVAEVWRAYTTDEGYASWAAPKARIDLRVGGTIRTQYDPESEIGDPGTNTLHIVNYVPERVLTLRAELSANWPEVMQQDAERLTNVILFEALSPTRTRIESYGLGYGDRPEYEGLLGFFLEANRGLYATLKDVLEPHR